MPDPLAHSPDMITIRPNKMPRLWWLFPWSYARVLHMSANAVNAYADRLDDILDIQHLAIGKVEDAPPALLFEDKTEEIPNLTITTHDENKN